MSVVPRAYNSHGYNQDSLDPLPTGDHTSHDVEGRISDLLGLVALGQTERERELEILKALGFGTATETQDFVLEN